MISQTRNQDTSDGSLDLRESDREVLDFLRNEPVSEVGFNGIKRRLGIHPERLSRALQRLERDNLVEKTELGYRLTSHARVAMSPTAIKPVAAVVPLLQTFLPPEVDLHELANTLRGRWFGSLRWHGLLETGQEIVLTWMSLEGSIQINARLRTSALSIEAQVADPSKLPAAIAASHELFMHIAAAYGSTRMNV